MTMLTPILNTSDASAKEQRMRIRQLLPKLFLGDYKIGPLNSLTDVPGVKVHTQQIFLPAGVNTGVTSITPRDDWLTRACYAGIFTFNGAGELTGVSLDPRNGTVAQSYYPHQLAQRRCRPRRRLPNVSSESVREGNVGGGTGMICHRFKGGTGSASRVVQGLDAQGGSRAYTVGALVQANYGKKQHLRIGGVPVGRILIAEAEDAARSDEEKRRAMELEELEDKKHRKDGSVIVILATDAPLNPAQLQRIARRATVGLAKVGGYGNNTSGDIFIAFSTGTDIPVESIIGTGPAVDPLKPKPLPMEIIDDTSINGLIEAAADATEEAIYNALCMAEDFTGFQDRKVEALPLGRLQQIMEKYL
ncbi:hypothetical protein G7054_g6969 [Neopestalotiopsis clavispora]|nr:hypothetical protein G7054_g6969 [Neopestalotiopsis clavispora]